MTNRDFPGSTYYTIRNVSLYECLGWCRDEVDCTAASFSFVVNPLAPLQETTCRLQNETKSSIVGSTVSPSPTSSMLSPSAVTSSSLSSSGPSVNPQKAVNLYYFSKTHLRSGKIISPHQGAHHPCHSPFYSLSFFLSCCTLLCNFHHTRSSFHRLAQCVSLHWHFMIQQYTQYSFVCKFTLHLILIHIIHVYLLLSDDLSIIHFVRPFSFSSAHLVSSLVSLSQPCAPLLVWVHDLPQDKCKGTKKTSAKERRMNEQLITLHLGVDYQWEDERRRRRMKSKFTHQRSIVVHHSLSRMQKKA